MRLPPSKPHPELDALIERCRHIKMTPAQKREQAISFVYGQMMDCAPDITREEVERIYDEHYGRPQENA